MSTYSLRPDMTLAIQDGFSVIKNRNGYCFNITKLEAFLIVALVSGYSINDVQKMLNREGSNLSGDETDRIFNGMGHFLTETSKKEHNEESNYELEVDYNKFLKGKFMDESSRKNYPLNISWRVTSKCNQSCKYCYARKRINSQETGLVESYADKLIAEANDAGVKGFLLTGGDPLLADGIEDIISSITKYEMSVTILTKNKVPNSLLNIDPSLLHIVFSLDNTDKDIADWITSRTGYYDEITDSMRCMNKLNYPFSIQMTMVRPFINNGAKIVKSMLDFNPKSIEINKYQSIGIQRIDNDFEISNGDWIKFKRCIEKEFDPSLEITVSSHHSENSCIAGINRISVDVNGEYILCDVVENSTSFGNATRNSLLDVWNDPAYQHKCLEEGWRCYEISI